MRPSQRRTPAGGDSRQDDLAWWLVAVPLGACIATALVAVAVFVSLELFVLAAVVLMILAVALTFGDSFFPWW